MTGLKQCSNCGSDQVVIYQDFDEDHSIVFKVKCMSCGIETTGNSTEEYALDEWNWDDAEIL